jgi:hypothetical protein
MLIATAPDKFLTLPLTGRDPLGIQAVWQHRARDVIPALTAASRRADGFRVLATGLAWWPAFASAQNARAGEQSRFFLLFEQAVARACRTGGKEWKLPGTRGLNSNRAGVWMGLDGAKHFLLDSPLSNGVWGIYRGPMINAGLIDADNLLSAEAAQSIRRRTPQLERLFHRLRDALRNPAQVTEIAVRTNNQLVHDLTAIVQPKLLRKDIDHWFVAGASDLCKELAVIGREAGAVGPQWIVREAISRLRVPEHRALLTRVRQCEKYIASIEAIFETFCAASGKGLAEAASAIKVDMGALRNAQAAFRDSGSYDGLAGQRHGELANAPMTGLTELGAYLIEHHGNVSGQRKSSPWVVINEAGSIACEMRIDAPPAGQLNPERAWRNGYYLDALQSLARDVTEEAA